MYPTLLAIGTGALSGILAHILIFRNGEWDLYTTKILQGLLIVFGLLVLSFKRLGATEAGSPYSFLESVIASMYMVSFLVSGTFFSIFIYRISLFHRLSKFPGPFMARVSNLYLTKRSVASFQLYREIQDLHRSYGDIVRVGKTSALSILDAKVFHAIHSNNSPCSKGPWYNLEQPAISLHMSRDKNDHSRRRRAWDRALSSKALRDYEARVVKYTSQLLDRLEQSQDIPIDIAKWFKFYSFDTMGDLTFGQSFNMLTDGVKHPFMALVESHMVMAGTFSQLIWMFPLFRAMPFLGREDAILQKWLETQVRHQEQNKPDLPNIFSWLLEDYKSQLYPKEQDWLNLQADMQLIAVTGSDTTSVTLTCLFFLLATNKNACVRLQEEIDDLFSSSSEPSHSSFSKLTYLQACIDETLRLFPPVPSGLQRMTPAEGLRAGDIFIPGNTVVTVPSYTLYRDERYFTAPDDFVPERWTTNPDMANRIVQVAMHAWYQHLLVLPLTSSRALFYCIMYSFSCQICGVDMAIARIRTPDEPPSAAWNLEGADYVGFRKWPHQDQFEDEDSLECATEDRGPARPPEVDAWPDQDDEDGPDWAPDAQSSSEEDPLEYDSGWETDNEDIEAEVSSTSDEEDSDYSNDAPDQYPLTDLYTCEFPDRLPHGTWHNGLAYYTGDRKHPEKWSLLSSDDSNVPSEHIASPSCQSLQGINGHVLSVAQMKNCRNVRFLVPKPSMWKADFSDQLLEGSSDNLFYVSGESSGSNMIEGRRFRGIHSLYPPRHGLKDISTSWVYVDEGCMLCQELDYSLVPLPVHSYCLDLYAKASLRRLGHVDLNGLWHWREMRNIPASYGLEDRISEPIRKQIHLPELQRARTQWDYPWLHTPGDEWLVANPVEIPGISRVLESCVKKLCLKGYAQQTTGFLALPSEIIQHTLSFLDIPDVDSAAKTCRAIFKLAQLIFRESVLRSMPWLWEILENNEYPASRDCLPTWDPLCPLGIPPPTLPIGLESEEEEEDRWEPILFEFPEMQQVCKATKAVNRQRREEIIAPYHEKLKVLLQHWHSFRRNVEVWIHGKGERRDMNWRRVWFLFNPATSPLPGIRNRARIWEDCKTIMDFVALAREGEHVEERHKELKAKISDFVDENSYALPDTVPDVPSWLQAY
ncbi:pisatin demethylase cytochrome P450 [Fusarium subglutinans]|uniref:Pisatin demethylase cytochrome P450 n=1 Tax=Gibberella subglutinans TaxID=42677 RepID=A0A8H5PAF4_GIBSU|nr:pisatin demethylase cytochrome P450 [Fusarium subglutinans]KAF5592963.1 pisatin demethylase cytochrome P450 [Fusarium subglutinans]